MGDGVDGAAGGDGDKGREGDEADDIGVDVDGDGDADVVAASSDLRPLRFFLLAVLRALFPFVRGTEGRGETSRPGGGAV